MELYKFAPSPIPIGDVVRPFSFKDRFMPYLQFADSTFNSEPETIRSLLLNDQLISIRTNTASNFPTSLIEIAFEHARTKLFPELPSRLESSYFFESIDLARQFKSTYNRIGYIYKCKFIDGLIFKGDMTLVNQGIDLNIDISVEISMLKDRAIQYWSASKPMKIPEILVKGTVTVQDVIEKDAP